MIIMVIKISIFYLVNKNTALIIVCPSVHSYNDMINTCMKYVHWLCLLQEQSLHWIHSPFFPNLSQFLFGFRPMSLIIGSLWLPFLFCRQKNWLDPTRCVRVYCSRIDPPSSASQEIQAPLLYVRII